MVHTLGCSRTLSHLQDIMMGSSERYHRDWVGIIVSIENYSKDDLWETY